MNRAVHCTIGVTTAIAFSVLHPTTLTIYGIKMLPEIMIIPSIIGSALPDWDLKPMHYSQGKKGFAKKVAQMQTKAVNTVTGGHRGITHTLLFPALFVVAMKLINQYLFRTSLISTTLCSIFAGLLLGWCLHILIDMLNGKGCPLLWPLIRSKISFLDLPSEGVVPWIIAFMWICAHIGYVILERVL